MNYLLLKWRPFRPLLLGWFTYIHYSSEGNMCSLAIQWKGYFNALSVILTIVSIMNDCHKALPRLYFIGQKVTIGVILFVCKILHNTTLTPGDTRWNSSVIQPLRLPVCNEWLSQSVTEALFNWSEGYNLCHPFVVNNTTLHDTHSRIYQLD